MSFEEAMALQPVWVVIWMNILLVGAFVAPLVLLIWRQSRKAGAITFVVSVFAGFCIQMMYNSLGYVKLLGLPHLLWIPVVMYLAGQARRADMPAWPRPYHLVLHGRDLCVACIRYCGCDPLCIGGTRTNRVTPP